MKAFRITAVVLIVLATVFTAWVAVWNGLGEDEYYNTALPNTAENGFIYLESDESRDGYATIYVPDGEFIDILVLTDPQVKYPVNNYENKYGASNDNTFTLIERMVARANPDLVVITGDIVMSGLLNNVTFLKRYANMFERLGVYWAPTFGNHDSEFSTPNGALADATGISESNKEYVVETLDKYPHCIIDSGDAGEGGGIGNYFINIRRADGELIYSLCMMDCVNTGGSKYLRYKTEAQTAWYERHLEAINAAEYGADAAMQVKSMLFTHVPLPEIFTAHEAWEEGDGSVEMVYGEIVEGSASAAGFDRCGMFEKIKELGSTTAVFSGHYHDNGGMLRYEGVDMVFVQHSGLAHYYRMDADSRRRTLDMNDIYEYGDDRGGTLVTISSRDSYSIRPFLAREEVEYADISVDYEAVYEDLTSRGWEVSR